MFSNLFQPLKLITRELNRFSKISYPWMNKWKPHWVRPLTPPTEQDVTPDNAAFLKEMRSLEYRMDTPLLEEMWPRHPWTPFKTQRCGLVGVKIGYYPMWNSQGEKTDLTLIQVLDNHVLRWIPPSELHLYEDSFKGRPYMPHPDWLPRWIRQRRWGIQLVGAISDDPGRYNKAYCGLFDEAGVPPKKKISRFLVSEDAAMKPGTPLTVHHFRVGDFVDITARTVNRGFQGVIERWQMSGGPAGHGSTKFHRKMGSAAGGGGPIKRGKRMPGVMGNRYRNQRCSQIVRINYRYNILFVRGTTPGPTHSYCQIHDSWMLNHRRALAANPPPMPTAYLDDIEELGDLPEDVFHSSLLSFESPSIVLPEDKVEKKKKK